MAYQARRTSSTRTQNSRARGSRYVNSGVYSSSVYNTSSAYELAEPEYVPRPRPAPQPKRKKQTSQIEYKKLSRRKTPFLTYFLALVVFTGATLFVAALAVKANASFVLSDLQSQNKKLHDENFAATNDNYYGYSLTEIDRLCRELGMSEPKEHQIVYVDVPTVSRIIQYEDDEPKAEQVSVDLISDVFGLFSEN